MVLAPRRRPAAFLRRVRPAAVLPWLRVVLARGMARRAFFLRVSTLRRLRVLLMAFTGLGYAGSRHGPEARSGSSR